MAALMRVFAGLPYGQQGVHRGLYPADRKWRLGNERRVWGGKVALVAESCAQSAGGLCRWDMSGLAANSLQG